MVKKRKAFIVGIKSYKLTLNEIKFLKKYKPWGIILFSRNIKSIEQTLLLTKKIRSIFKDINYPIIIDEEGGRVSRLRHFIDNSLFSAKYFGAECFYVLISKFVLTLKLYLLTLCSINLKILNILQNLLNQL